MKVYTKIDDKLAMWEVETTDTEEARKTVIAAHPRQALTRPVLALVQAPYQLELF